SRSRPLLHAALPISKRGSKSSFEHDSIGFAYIHACCTEDNGPYYESETPRCEGYKKLYISKLVTGLSDYIKHAHFFPSDATATRSEEHTSELQSRVE